MKTNMRRFASFSLVMVLSALALAFWSPGNASAENLAFTREGNSTNEIVLTSIGDTRPDLKHVVASNSALLTVATISMAGTAYYLIRHTQYFAKKRS